MTDLFSERCGDLLTGSYDCVDRIVLNACFSVGHNPGGFRCWWRRLHGGSDDPYTLPDFNEVWFGWWLYQEDPVPDHFDVWIDEIAVDYARIGCDI